MFELTIHRGRTEQWTATLTTAAGGNVTLAEADVVRFKLGRGLSAPLLDLDNVATAAGSLVTVTQLNPGQYTLRVAQDDTASLAPGDYDAEVIVVDSSETAPANAAKHVEYGIVHLLPSMAGDVGL